MINTTNELVIEAELEAFNDLQEELNDSPWLPELEERLELENALQETVVVSDAVRLACEADLAAAAKRNWQV